MKAPIDYLALAIVLAPVSAVLTIVLCRVMARLNRWLDRLFTVQPGNRYREESWHSKQPGECLRKRN